MKLPQSVLLQPDTWRPPIIRGGSNEAEPNLELIEETPQICSTLTVPFLLSSIHILLSIRAGPVIGSQWTIPISVPIKCFQILCIPPYGHSSKSIWPHAFLGLTFARAITLPPDLHIR